MLDTAGFLSSFGWQGKGNGLRQGSVSRPLAIPQKRTLSGLGKDRDDAFPFWDHLFAAASKSIKIKVSGDEDEEIDGDTALTPSSLLRTTTGILSNRRPISGTPASSGSVTPTGQATPRLSLMAVAKRELARKRLYAGFFKGPVLGPEVDLRCKTQSTPIALHASTTVAFETNNTDSQIRDRKRKHKEKETGHEEKKSKKSKHKETCPDGTIVKKRKKKNNQDTEARSLAKTEEREVSQIPLDDRTETSEERRHRKAAKLERRKRKEERRIAKEPEWMTSDVHGEPD